jgi:hypothetical protein
MGNVLFGVDIAAIIAGAMGDSLMDVLITKKVRGERVPGNLSAGRPVSDVPFACAGFWDDNADVPVGVELAITDRIATLIGDTIPAGGIPVQGDSITIEGITATVTRPIGRDPAAAVYTYLCSDSTGPDGV